MWFSRYGSEQTDTDTHHTTSHPSVGRSKTKTSTAILCCICFRAGGAGKTSHYGVAFTCTDSLVSLRLTVRVDVHRGTKVRNFDGNDDRRSTRSAAVQRDRVRSDGRECDGVVVRPRWSGWRGVAPACPRVEYCTVTMSKHWLIAARALSLSLSLSLSRFVSNNRPSNCYCPAADAGWMRRSTASRMSRGDC